MDLVASVIAFFAVRIASRPADAEHPYGHAKFENVSGVVEALLIIVAAGWIVVESVLKILAPQPVGHIGWGVVVMVVSALVNLVVSTILARTARATGSIALEADALHLRMDVYTSAGVAVGLALITVTGYTILDPIIAVAVALFIVREGYVLLVSAFHPLVDAGFSADELGEVEAIIRAHGVDYHNLRTRRAGNARYVDVHVEIDGDMKLVDAHAICDRIEHALEERFEGIDTTIHADPRGLVEKHKKIEKDTVIPN